MSTAGNMCTDAYSQIVSVFAMLFISLQTICSPKKTLRQKALRAWLFFFMLHPDFLRGNAGGKLLETSCVCPCTAGDLLHRAKWQVAAKCVRQWVPQAPEPQSHGASLGYPLIFLAAAEHPGRV